ncbi:MAG TPA: NADP-dependent oxidoreductase [Polyangiaceae bacterium]|jgi:NADPH:quinone reductase-like Zn-dependent oxidoreductase|nr:NADP-dependent oxidoreductase [Polyangiaceae bacterium]
MKAARIHSYGGPEVLVVDDVPDPACGPDDVLVEVHASSVNPIDCKIRAGSQRGAVRLSLPARLGMDVSGVVVEVGSRVSGFAVGDEVWSSPHHKRQGTYAELIAIRADEVAKKPVRMTHAEAASIPLVGLTAWACLVDAADLQAGESVLIEAGSGGVGCFAIQLAKHLGAHVSTTCSGRNAEFVRALGADTVVDYTKEAFDEVLPPQDVVLEAMGGDSKQRAFKVLKRGGRLASINSDLPALTKKFGPNLGVVAAGGKIASMIACGMLTRGVKARPVIRKCSGEDLTKLAALCDAGHIKAVLDRTFSLADIAGAHAYSETGRARGKIAIRVR